MVEQIARQPAHRLEAVERTQRRAQGVGADARAGPVVADQKAAASDDPRGAADAGDARRAGAGDDQSAVVRPVRADAGGDGVVDHLDARPAGQRSGDPRGVGGAGKAGETDPQRDPAPARRIALGLGDHAADKFADDADPGVEIHVNVGRRADLLREFAPLRVAQPRPAARRAAVHADEEFRPRHAPGPQKFVGDH